MLKLKYVIVNELKFSMNVIYMLVGLQINDLNVQNALFQDFFQVLTIINLYLTPLNVKIGFKNLSLLTVMYCYYF